MSIVINLKTIISNLKVFFVAKLCSQILNHDFYCIYYISTNVDSLSLVNLTITAYINVNFLMFYRFVCYMNVHYL